MKKFFLSSILALSTLMLFQSSSAEARHHRHSRTNFNVNVGSCVGCRDTYVVRRYAQPVAVAAPVYVAPYAPQYAPVQYAPAYAYPPVTYVEQVYVAPRPAIVPFGGFSFSWNFFK